MTIINMNDFKRGGKAKPKPKGYAKLEHETLGAYLDVVGAIDRIENGGFTMETVKNLLDEAKYLVHVAGLAYESLDKEE